MKKKFIIFKCFGLIMSGLIALNSQVHAQMIESRNPSIVHSAGECFFSTRDRGDSNNNAGELQITKKSTGIYELRLAAFENAYLLKSANLVFLKFPNGDLPLKIVPEGLWPQSRTGQKGIVWGLTMTTAQLKSADQQSSVVFNDANGRLVVGFRMPIYLSGAADWLNDC